MIAISNFLRMIGSSSSLMTTMVASWSTLTHSRGSAQQSNEPQRRPLIVTKLGGLAPLHLMRLGGPLPSVKLQRYDHPSKIYAVTNKTLGYSSFNSIYSSLMNNTTNFRVGQVVSIWHLGIILEYQSLPCALSKGVKSFYSLGLTWWQRYIPY